MKKTMKVLGMAALYLALFFLIQQIAASVAGNLITMNILNKQGFEILDNEALWIDTVEAAWDRNINLVSLAADVLIVLTLWAIFACRKKKFSSEIRLYKIPWGTALACVVLGVATSYAYDIFVNFLPIPDAVWEEFGEAVQIGTTGNPWIELISTVLVAPAAEEVLFRGLIYQKLKTGMKPIMAGTIGAILFGLIHGQSIWIFLAFLGGVAMTWAFEKTGSLYGAFFVHAGHNAVSILSDYIEPQTDLTYWITLLASWVLLIGSAIYLMRKHPQREKVSAA